MATKTTFTVNNASPELLAQLEALLATISEENSPQLLTVEIQDKNILGFLNLTIDQSKVEAESSELFNKESFAKAQELKARRNQNANLLANVL